MFSTWLTLFTWGGILVLGLVLGHLLLLLPVQGQTDLLVVSGLAAVGAAFGGLGGAILYLVVRHATGQAQSVDRGWESWSLGLLGRGG